MSSQTENTEAGQVAVVAPAEGGNWLNKVINTLDKLGIFARWINIIGIALLFAMIVLNTVDVVMDINLIHSPIKGATGLTEIMMIAGIFLAMAHSQNEGGHITVDIFTSKLSPKNKLSSGFVNTILGMGTFGIIIWRVLDQTVYFAQKNVMHDQYLNIPSAPFAGIIAFGCALMALLLLRDFLKIVVEASNTKFSALRWSVTIAVPVILGVLIYLFMQADIFDFSMPIIALLGCLAFVVLLLGGFPIAFTMMLTAVVFVAHIRGPLTAFNMIGTDMYRSAGSYGYAVLPFFMMMGFFCLHARFGDDLYDAGYKWLGHLRGGLAFATIAACTAFAAIVGDPIASV
jgi:TRAP-type C4-dicarboxylate transport system permease small subunit